MNLNHVNGQDNLTIRKTNYKPDAPMVWWFAWTLFLFKTIYNTCNCIFLIVVKTSNSIVYNMQMKFSEKKWTDLDIHIEIAQQWSFSFSSGKI